MRSSWVWIMVLVALGSAQVPPEETPNIDLEKMKGIWYPLATASDDGNLRPAVEYRINPKKKKIFEIMVPVSNSGVCEKKTTIATAFNGGLKVDSTLIGENMYFMETNYTNYHIVYISFKRRFTLYLYGRSRVLTEHMKTRFARKVDHLKINPDHINYNPKIECSF